ncbi:MAG: M23 family metallopeptidase [bacterium]|nr:M23 family metallopeptidase [bacterium]
MKKRISWNRGAWTFTVAMAAFLIGAPLQSERDVYSRKAVAPPAEARTGFDVKPEGDEIDREIEQYFSGVSKSQNTDIDEKKLEQLFGPATPLDHEGGEHNHAADGGESGSFSFSNSGAKDAGNGVAAHKVKKGETIWSISRRYGMKPARIVEHNPELKSRPLYIGEEILIVREAKKGPVTAKKKTRVVYYKVKSGDTLSHIARRNRVSVANLQKWNRINKKGVIKIGQRLKIYKRGGKAGPPPGYKYGKFFDWPLRGVITSGYGRRSNPFVGARRQYHRGIDIGARMGTPIRAARDGVVIMSRRMGGYGNCIFVRHSNGYVSVYAHNMVNKVRVGQVVKRGAIIGKVGRTGSATGPHLHFEIRRWKKPINPLSALNMKELIPKKVATR